SYRYLEEAKWRVLSALASAPWFGEQERTPYLIVDVGLFVADGIDDARKHRRRQMHGDDAIGLRIELVGHPRILEADESKSVSLRVAQLDLGPIVQISRLAAIEQ